MKQLGDFPGRRIVRVLVVDDHPTVCEGLRHCIDSQPDMTACGEAADVSEALEAIVKTQPQVAIIDIGLRHSDGLDLIKAIRTKHRFVHTIVHSMYDECVYANRCLTAGAMGYVCKDSSPDNVVQAIRTVMDGKVYLSPEMTNQVLGHLIGGNDSCNDPIDSLSDRQLEVLRLIGNGLNATSIADQLGISIHTVESHRANIKRKLRVESLSELARVAVLWVSGK